MNILYAVVTYALCDIKIQQQGVNMKTHKTIIILILSNLKLNNSIFNYMLNQPLGQAIAEFLNTESNIQKMIDASDKGRPAIGALGNDIYRKFVNPMIEMSEKEVHKWKQFIGYLVRVILEANGYAHNESGVKVEEDNFFIFASTYIKKYINK